MDIKEKERRLGVERYDILIGHLGCGVSLHPMVLLGFGVALKWWPCTRAIALQVSLMQYQVYICWMFSPGEAYRTEGK